MRGFNLKLGSRTQPGSSDRDPTPQSDHLVPRFEEFRPLFEREMRRARRYERPFSILVLAVPDSGDPDQRAYRMARIGTVLQGALRETDLIGSLADSGELVALLPEADAAAAGDGSRRIHELLAAVGETQIHAGTATYRAHGLTLHDLLEYARRESRSHGPSGNGRHRLDAHPARPASHA